MAKKAYVVYWMPTKGKTSKHTFYYKEDMQTFIKSLKMQKKKYKIYEMSLVVGR